MMSRSSIYRGLMLYCRLNGNRVFGATAGCRHSSTSIDPEEVAKFDSFNWDGDHMRALRAMNELRVPLIRDQLDLEKRATKHPLSGKKLLDVGCGGGLLAEPLAVLGAHVTGVDPNLSAIEYAINHRDEYSPELIETLHYVPEPLEALVKSESVSKLGNQFDGVILSEVLEHTADVESLLKICHGLLKPEGRLFITTINQTATAQLLAIFAAERVLRLLPPGTHEYNKLVSLVGLKVMLELNHFRVELVHGMAYNPFTNHWWWSSITKVNYALVASKRGAKAANGAQKMP